VALKNNAKTKTQQSTRGRELGRIKRVLRRRLPDLTERYHVQSLGLFGSYVRHEQTKRSDLDVLVDFAKTPNLFELMDLEDYLVQALGVKVDLVTRTALRGEIGDRILREVIPV
jgi:predicted nucleotidyltransferase